LNHVRGEGVNAGGERALGVEDARDILDLVRGYGRRAMPAPPAGKLPKDYDRLPVPQPQATSERKRDPKMLAIIDPGRCFGRGCEYCVAVCPVPDCITLAPDPAPAASNLHVLSVNYDTCIGCMACEKWCPDDYDAIRMVPFAAVVKDRQAYETATFSAELPVKKIGQ
jgi:formate hydrogenlyase subunit 6/NADH:ubiquinone oxidoreductase subunit I